MKFPRFDMERMQSVWEHRVKYDLSESGVEALTLAEITRDPKELLKTRLGYAEGVGREATRALIAGIHPGHGADDVMITTGTSEANFLALASLVTDDRLTRGVGLFGATSVLTFTGGPAIGLLAQTIVRYGPPILAAGLPGWVRDRALGERGR